jgi:hypothetical protein
MNQGGCHVALPVILTGSACTGTPETITLNAQGSKQWPTQF